MAPPLLVVAVDPGPGWEDTLGLLEAAAGQHGLAWLTVAPGWSAAELPSDTESAAVCCVGPAAPGALEAAGQDGRVRAVVLVSPVGLDAGAAELLAEWPEAAVLAVADPLDRPALSSAVDAYLASRHTRSDLLAGPFDEARGNQVGAWLAAVLAGAGRVSDVVVGTPDGWELHGTIRLPVRSEPVPGVVLLHSGRSDRSVYSRLERLLADAGLAVLNLDWRGRGQSTNRGTLTDLSEEERLAGWRDPVAALGVLAAYPEVDPGRLAVVGVVQGAELAVRAAVRDERVRALVLLTGYRPASDDEARHLTGGTVEVLYVASADHGPTTRAMRDLYDASPGRRTRYVEYPGTALGYQLFETDPHLEPSIVAWLAEVLEP